VWIKEIRPNVAIFFYTYGSSRQSYTCCMRAVSDLTIPYLLLQIGCQAVPGDPFRMHVHPQWGQRRHQDRKSPRESSPPIRGFLLLKLVFFLLRLLDDDVCGQDLMAGGGPSVHVWPGQWVSRHLQGHATFRSEEAENGACVGLGAGGWRSGVSVCLSFCLSACLAVFLSVCLSVCLSIYLSIDRSMAS